MDTALRESIEIDLLYELKYLLCAATEWEAQRILVGEPPTIKEPCAHVKVYTMDSAFVHARCLYEFFTSTKPPGDKVNWQNFGQNAGQSSAKYDTYRDALHLRSIHLGKNRASQDEIKNEVVNFATDVLDLWDFFSKNPDLKDYAIVLDQTRKQAIKEAEAVANQYAAHGFKCPFSKTAR